MCAGLGLGFVVGLGLGLAGSWVLGWVLVSALGLGCFLGSFLGCFFGVFFGSVCWLALEKTLVCFFGFLNRKVELQGPCKSQKIKASVV